MGEVSSAPWREAASGRWLRSLGLGRFGRAAIILYATIVLAIGWAYGFWRIQNDRSVTLGVSYQQLATLSKSLASQVEAMVNDGVGAARAGANVLADFPESHDPHQLLSDMLTGGPYVRAIFVVAGDRMLIANAAGENLTQDKAVWLQDLRGSAVQSWVGSIIVESDGMKLPFARHIQRVNGADAWAGALVRVSDLEDIYGELLSSHTVLSLVTTPGRVIFQLPRARDNFIDVDISESGIFRQFLAMPTQSTALLAGPRPQPSAGEQRYYAVSRLEALPLLVSASRSVDDILVEWRERKRSSLQFLFVSTVTVYALAIALQTLLNRRFIALERSEARFQLAAAGTNDGLLEWEAGTGMVYCTPRARELLQLPDAAGGVGFDALRGLVYPEDLERVTTALRQHVNDRVPLDLEMRLLVGSEARWFHIRGQALWNEVGTPVRLAAAIGDIHVAVQAQQEIAEARRAELKAKESLARELLLAQERERKRLAGELHDGVAQNLSLLRNRAILLQRMELPPAAVPHAQALLDLSTESIQDLRNVARNLRPAHLEELGVSASLRSLVHRVEQSSELQVKLRIEDIDDVVDADAATHLYRIVQEAINNVLKHAQARNLWVEVIRDIAHVTIDIRDDGMGFRLPAAATHAGLGLLSIRERCGILRAELLLQSGAQRGAHLRVRIPIPDEGHADA